MTTKEQCQQLVDETIEKVKSIDNVEVLIITNHASGIYENGTDYKLHCTLDFYKMLEQDSDNYELTFMDLWNYFESVENDKLFVINPGNNLHDRIYYKKIDTDDTGIILYSVNKDKTTCLEDLVLKEEAIMSFGKLMSYYTKQHDPIPVIGIVEITKLKTSKEQNVFFMTNVNVSSSNAEGKWWKILGDFGQKLENALLNHISK